MNRLKAMRALFVSDLTRLRAWVVEVRRGIAVRRGRGRSSQRAVRVLIGALLLLVVAFVWSINYTAPRPYGSAPALSLDQIDRLASSGQILFATFEDEDAQIIGEYCTLPASADSHQNLSCPQQDAQHPGIVGKRVQYYAPYFRSDAVTQDLVGSLRGRTSVQVDRQERKAVVKFVSQFILPLVMLANLFGIIFAARGSQAGLSDIIGFGSIGRSRQRKRRINTAVTFADVAGAEEAVAELREVKDYLTDPKRFAAMGALPPKGVLLFGPPGCGKTLLARAVAGEAGVPFFAISGAEFVESLVGVGAARVRDLFTQVRRVAPAIVFIDELDAAGRRRSGEGGSGGEREQTLNQLLVEMDGFEVSAGIVVMGATNRPDIIDPALLRPGRFDRHITVDQPDLVGRQAILELHGHKRPLSPDVDFQLLARRTPGFTGADLANVINEAALLAIREGHPEITMGQLLEGIQRVLSGPKRRGHLMTGEERKRVAMHESGHAIVAAALGRIADVQRVSIVARGRGIGQSIVSRESDRVLLTRSELEVQLTTTLGGLAAEELRFQEPSTSSENDIEQATDLARQMVGRYGMSPQLGRVRVLSKDADVFLGADGTGMAVMSAETMLSFDHEVKRLLDVAEQRATDVLTAHEEHLDALAAALEKGETLEGPELEALLAPVRPEVSLVGASAASSRIRAGARAGG